MLIRGEFVGILASTIRQSLLTCRLTRLVASDLSAAESQAVPRSNFTSHEVFEAKD